MKLTNHKLSEADVTGQVRGFMESRGWHALRMQRTVVPGQFSTCQPGTPDFCFIRYVPSPLCAAAALVLWVELKRPGVRAKCRCLQIRGTRKRCTACDQATWRDQKRAMGALVWTQVDSINWVMREYERVFGWLHTGTAARGQLDLLAGIGVGA